METEQLDLVEYEKVSAIPLTLPQRDALLEYPLTVQPTPGASDRYDLTASSEIGSIELPGLSIRILPKLPIERVFFLISYAVGGLSLSDTKTEFEDQPDLVEAVVAGFVFQIRHALRPGLLQGYRVEEDALTTVRGRIRIEAQLGKRFGVTPPIEVRYDDFTVDIEENRIIKAALARLSRMRLRSERSRRDLRSFGAALSNVTTVEYQQLPEFVFTRLNLRYEPAVRLAGLILRSTSYELTRGGVSSSSFLIDMNRVFEDFVVHSLRDELHLTEREFPQGGSKHRLMFDVGGRIRLKPDISWWRGDRCVFVGDAKYKKTIAWRVPNADLYQLHAYATATDLPGGILIYAAGEDEPGIHTVKYAGKRLEVAALGLAGPPKRILRDIERVADRIRILRNEASETAA